ncbi:hypothetical protein IA539_01160 [Gordonia sp. zg691]|uniref:hypothetical protein n=1 Tax=Gordonia jinghuaiqii TaxID=2758710 RepID=UPI0016625C2C|nr:hypothetical protein [Gordonia jinghuaiqii]MBD0859827.1 hypothetical protein [Gordonia jinghuaiqii]
MTNAPDPEILLSAVISAIEETIAPAVADEYAASTCRTAAQMLRQLGARLGDELPAVVHDAHSLRRLLTGLGESVSRPPEPRWPDIDEARADLAALEAQLAELVLAEPNADAPARVAARVFLAEQLPRRLSWERDAYTGPRR